MTKYQDIDAYKQDIQDLDGSIDAGLTSQAPYVLNMSQEMNSSGQNSEVEWAAQFWNF